MWSGLLLILSSYLFIEENDMSFSFYSPFFFGHFTCWIYLVFPFFCLFSCSSFFFPFGSSILPLFFKKKKKNSNMSLFWNSILVKLSFDWFKIKLCPIKLGKIFFCMELEFIELKIHTYSYVLIVLLWCFKWNLSSMNSRSVQFFIFLILLFFSLIGPNLSLRFDCPIVAF